MPRIIYVLYPSAIAPDELGSIAIYCERVSVQYEMLKCRGVLFGHRVKSVSLEMGLRPFVDVKLRA